MAEELCLGASCQSFSDSTHLLVNTTSTADCSVVRVACSDSRQQLANLVNVYTCNNGHWLPFTPRACIDDEVFSNANIAVVVGCTVGVVVCLLLIIVSIYLIIKSRQQGLLDQQRDLMYNEKQRRIWEYRLQSAQYNDGCHVPAATNSTEHSLFERPACVYRSTDQLQPTTVDVTSAIS